MQIGGPAYGAGIARRDRRINARLFFTKRGRVADTGKPSVLGHLDSFSGDVLQCVGWCFVWPYPFAKPLCA